MRANHKLQEHNTSLETSVFVRLINDSVSKLSKDDCFPDSIKEKFKNFILCIDPLMPLVKEYQCLVSNFQGNAEKFYSKAYGINSNSKVIGNLDLISTKLMLGELANNILSYMQMLNSSDTQEREINVISEKEKQGLQYVVGHIFHKFYKKFRSKKDWESVRIQELLSILKSAKIEEDDTRRLVNVKDRGGLWKVNNDTQKIFEICEIEFQRNKNEIMKYHKIDINDLCENLLKSSSVQSHYYNIYSSVSPKVSKENAVNLLEELILLYLRIRSHSFAKDVKETFKMKSKKSKQRSLRTTIKKASIHLDYGH